MKIIICYLLLQLSASCIKAEPQSAESVTPSVDFDSLSPEVKHTLGFRVDQTRSPRPSLVITVPEETAKLVKSCSLRIFDAQKNTIVQTTMGLRPAAFGSVLVVNLLYGFHGSAELVVSVRFQYPDDPKNADYVFRLTSNP